MSEKRFGKLEYIVKKPEEKFRIAILYQIASYWPTIESFYIACVTDDDTDVRIFWVDDLSVETAQAEGADVFLQEKGIPYIRYSEEAIKTFSPHVALYQPPYDVSYRNPPALSIHLRNMGIRILYIPYGIEIADTEDAHYNHFSTYVIRNSWRIYTFSERMLEDYRKYCPNRDAVRALGIPKLDAVFHRDLPADETVAHKAQGRKVLLWKMHFPKLIYEGETRRQVTPYLQEYQKFAESIEKFEDLFFVVMPHPMFFSHTIDRVLAKEAEQLLAVLASKRNVLIDRSADYRGTLFHSDAIIVDRSALMVEAGLCGVPVLYMKNSDYEEPLTGAVKLLVDAYEQGTSAEDMKIFVEKFRRDELENVTERIMQARQATFPYLDGRCGERILDDIKKGINESPDRPIRVVFFGAGFICDHYLKYLDILQDSRYCVIALSDNDSKKWGTIRSGIPVVPPEELQNISFDILVISSEQYHTPIKKKLVYELYLEEEKIWRLDMFAERYLRDRESQSGV